MIRNFKDFSKEIMNHVFYSGNIKKIIHDLTISNMSF